MKKKENLLLALENSLGNISEACKASNISRVTFYEWLKTDQDFASAVEDINELCLDKAESKLHYLIDQGHITAIIFYLKNKGKSRGYSAENDTQPPHHTQPPQKIEISILPN